MPAKMSTCISSRWLNPGWASYMYSVVRGTVALGRTTGATAPERRAVMNAMTACSVATTVEQNR